MVKCVAVQKKPKGVRTKKLKKVTSKPSITSFDDMNDDCLMSIFDHLDTYSLVKITKMNQRLKGIVVDRVIPLKTVKFGEIGRNSSVRKVFEKFGRSLTRLSINADDIQMTQPGYSRFAEFLRLLMVYSLPGKLKQLTIGGFGDEFFPIPAELLVAVGPYLKNVHTLSVNLPNGTYSFLDDFMNNIPKHNIRHLHLNNVLLIGQWLSVESLPSLQSFDIDICIHRHHFYRNSMYDNENMNRLKRYIAEKPQLTEFGYEGRNREEILMEVSRHIPNITRIGKIESWWFDEQTNQGKNIGYRAKWKYLNQFTNLKHFSLRSCAQDLNNCGEIFRILAGRNTIEHLVLFSGSAWRNCSNPIDFDDLRKMTNVKSLCLVNFGCQSDEFVGQLLENLTELYECTFEKTYGRKVNEDRIINLIQTGRNLRFLNMDSISTKLYRKLVKIRKDAHPDLVDQPLVIRVPKKVSDRCYSKLSSRSYQPTIIAIQPTQS